MAVQPFRFRIGKGTGSGSGVYGSASADISRIAGEFSRFIGHLKNSAPEVLHDSLVPTFEKSKEYCPVKTGELRDSGYLEILANGQVVMGYGRGGNPDYAPIVHEDTTISHASPTRSKWMEAALKEDEGAIFTRLSKKFQATAGLG